MRFVRWRASLLMTPAQTLTQLRQELAMNERLAELLRDAAKHHADSIYRSTTKTVDPSSLLRLTGAAAGVEDFISTITESPKAAKTARSATR